MRKLIAIVLLLLPLAARAADSYTVTLNADNSATVVVVWDISGTGLLASCAANQTIYTAPAAGGPYTNASAIAAVQAQAPADKANWVTAMLAAGQ